MAVDQPSGVSDLRYVPRTLRHALREGNGHARVESATWRRSRAQASACGVRRLGARRDNAVGPEPERICVLGPSKDEQHRYVDRLKDSIFHYTGEDQLGDQRMIRGNAAILNPETEARALRVFTGARGTVLYEGEFELDPAAPYYGSMPRRPATGRCAR